jgi:IS4 transposase
MEIYSTRWTIEVFFKEAKQLLGLGQMSIHEF